jgi:hypothetical protein
MSLIMVPIAQYLTFHASSLLCRLPRGKYCVAHHCAVEWIVQNVRISLHVERTRCQIQKKQRRSSLDTLTDIMVKRPNDNEGIHL